VSGRVRAALLLIAAASFAFGGFASADGTNSRRAAALWTKARAMKMVESAPPPRWVKRGWDVVYADCSGLRKGRGHGRRRLFRNFSCEITVVRPTTDCPSTGDYVCIAGFESSTLERTLHVLDRNRYALYRVP